MNTLRLNIINLHAPYRVWQKSGKPDHYYFVSDSGVEFKQSWGQIPVPTATSGRASPEHLIS